jgi:hypothetical protein
MVGRGGGGKTVRAAGKWVRWPAGPPAQEKSPSPVKKGVRNRFLTSSPHLVSFRAWEGQNEQLTVVWYITFSIVPMRG